MVVHVGLFAVFGLFLLLAVIVAVRQRVVVVLMGMPVRPVFPLVQRIIRVVMRHVIVVVAVCTSGMRVFRLLPLAFSALARPRRLHAGNLP